MTEEEILVIVVPQGHDTRVGACEECRFIEIYNGNSEERRCTIDISTMTDLPEETLNLWKAAIAATLGVV